MKSTGFFLLAALAIGASPAVRAQALELDSSYGSAGVAVVAFDLVDNGGAAASAANVLADGRLVLAGGAQSTTPPPNPPSYTFAFARLDAANGALDPGFGASHDGRATTGDAAPSLSVRDAAPLGDGRLLYVGDDFGDTAYVGRLDANGLADPGFAGTGLVRLTASTFVADATTLLLHRVRPQADGTSLVVGMAYAAKAAGIVARFDADGSLDTHFGGGRGFVVLSAGNDAGRSFEASDAVVAADGHILVAGTAARAASGFEFDDMSVVSLLADGSVDTTTGSDGWFYVPFGPADGSYTSRATTIVDAGSRIVLGGSVSAPNVYFPAGVATIDFLANGQVRTTTAIFDFGAGSHHADAVVALFPQSGGRFLAGVTSVGGGGGVAMLASDLSLDPTFGDGGKAVLDASPGNGFGAVQATNFAAAGDHLYMIGDVVDIGSGNSDFAAARYVMPLFKNGFDGPAPAR